MFECLPRRLRPAPVQIPVDSGTVVRADVKGLPFGRSLTCQLRFNSLAGLGEWSDPSSPLRTLGPVTTVSGHHVHVNVYAYVDV
jgi:hypothetical protein